MTLRIKRCGDCGSIRLCGTIAVCPGCRMAIVAGDFVHLTPSEARVLFRLAINPGECVSKRDLLDWLYGAQPDGGPDWAAAVLRNRIWGLRSAIRYQIVKTGAGYLLDVSSELRAAA